MPRFPPTDTRCSTPAARIAAWINPTTYWFLVGTFGSTEERTCVVPDDRPIFFPIVNFIAWGPEDGETEEDLLSLANFFMDPATLECEIDGIPLGNLASYRVESPAFSFDGPDDPEENIFGLDGGRELAVSDGYWILHAPFSVGEHEIHFRGVLTFTVEEHGFDFVFETEVTYHLLVVPFD